MTKHCPACGRGLSAKYRGKPHHRFVTARARRGMGTKELRDALGVICSYKAKRS